MIDLAADEDFNNRIVRGLLRRQGELNVVRIQDVGLSGVDDPTVLEWASREGRILLTHDANTMIRTVSERLVAGKPVSGVLIVPQSMAIGTAIDDILAMATCSTLEEWSMNPVQFLPL